GDEEPPAARRAGGRGLVQPGRDAAAREVPVRHVAFDIGVEHPALASGGGVEGNHASKWSADVHRPVHDEGSRLEGGGLVGPEARLGLAGAIRPGHLQPADVGSGYARGGGIARALWIASVDGPIPRGWGSLEREQREQQWGGGHGHLQRW